MTEAAAGPGEARPDQRREIRMRKEIFHRVAQGSVPYPPSQVGRGANKWPRHGPSAGSSETAFHEVECDYSAIRSLESHDQQKIRLGTCAWSFDEWRGKLLSGGLAARRAGWNSMRIIFPAVEIDSTFYSAPAEATVRRWVGIHAGRFSFCLQAARAKSRTRAGCAIAAPNSTAFLRAIEPLASKLQVILIQLPPSFAPKDGQSGFAGISGATAARFSFRDRIPPRRLASAAVHSPSRKTSRLLGLGRHQPAERTQSRAVRIPAAHDRFPLSAAARRLLHQIRSRRRSAFIATANFSGNAKRRWKAGRSRSSGIWPKRGASGLS